MALYCCLDHETGAFLTGNLNIEFVGETQLRSSFWVEGDLRDAQLPCPLHCPLLRILIILADCYIDITGILGKFEVYI